MNIRTAVAVTLAVFLLSIGTIIAVGLSQPLPPAPTVNAPVSAPVADVAQVRRDFLAGSAYQPSAAPPQPPQGTVQASPNVTEQPAQQPAPQVVAPPPQQPPVYVAPPPPPPQPDYTYRTRAS